MQVERINLFRITLPFQKKYAISKEERRSLTRIVVEVAANQGNLKGHGEGIPIESVTGETPETVIRDLTSFACESFFPSRLTEVSQIWNFVDRLPQGKEHHAALCALEMALLDALGKEERRSLGAYLPQQFATPYVHYGATIPLGDRSWVAQLCGMIRHIGIRHVRIKMGLDFEQNRTALETVREVFGSDCVQRVDPNGVWNLELGLRHLPLLAEHGVAILEEPMPRTEPGFSEFAEAARARGLTLMACESAAALDEVKAILQEGQYRMFNVKLCRSGGFRRTLKIIDHLREKGIPFQIGCTMGEAGLLSAAGRALALVCSDAVTYDGSYDRFMLEENLIENDVTFGPAGKAGPLGGHGLGVTVQSETLARLSDFSTTLLVR